MKISGCNLPKGGSIRLIFSNTEILSSDINSLSPCSMSLIIRRNTNEILVELVQKIFGFFQKLY